MTAKEAAMLGFIMLGVGVFVGAAVALSWAARCVG